MPISTCILQPCSRSYWRIGIWISWKSLREQFDYSLATIATGVTAVAVDFRCFDNLVGMVRERDIGLGGRLTVSMVMMMVGRKNVLVDRERSDSL